MSEVIGSLIMIALIVTVVSILSVTYLSQPPPEKTPLIEFQVGIQGNTLVLYHNGGDALRTFKGGVGFSDNSDYYILINNDDKWPIIDSTGNPDILNSTYDEGHKFKIEKSSANPSTLDYFSNGDKLVAKFDDSLPENIKVVYKEPSGAEKIIWTATISEGVNFYAADRRACLNQPVLFYDGSNNHPKTWLWNFGDGSTSTEQNPTHSYSNIGYYTVTLNTTVGDTSLPYSIRKDNYIDVRHVHAAFSGSPRVGEEPLRVDFTDESLCNPTGWNWDLGDGAASLSTAQNPWYTYITNGDGKPKKFPITLTTASGPYSDTLTVPDYITVNPKCFAPVANFQYTGRRDIDNTLELQFTDLSSSAPETIVSWLWDFGDGTSSTEQNPMHEYPGTNYTITLTVGNDCGRYNSTSRKIVFPCTNLTPLMQVAPLTGPSPLNVSMSDNSSPVEAISAWWWSFGDGTTYTSTDPNTRNPPNHTYDRVGTYYVSLMIQNECGQAFYKTPVVVVSQDASVAGKVWNDQNSDRTLNSYESVSQNWKVTLQERVNGIWQNVSTAQTNTTGDYFFDLQGVSYGVFRVVEDLPANWQPTYSYGTYAQTISDNLLVYNQRDFQNIDFGNVQLHTSQISVPGWFVCTGTGPKAFYSNPYLFKYSSLSDTAARYLDYNTSYNTVPRVVFMNPIGSSNGTFTPDPPGGYSNGYTSWGDSSFILKMRKYNTYIKQTSSGAYFLDIWQYNNGTGYKNYYSGDTFAVPDNKTIAATQLQLIYVYHPEDVFDFDKPDEGAVIPYTSSYTVEAHMEGVNESITNAWLISPVTTKFSYNSTVGEYLVASIDTRPFEGQTKLFKGMMNLTNGTKLYTMVNATIDWEPNTVKTPNVTSEIPYTSPNWQVKGNVTVNASIGGKWQLNNSAVMVVNDNQVVNMSVITPGYNSTVRGTFNAEPYAGKTIPVYVSVPHAKGASYTVNSPRVNMTVLAKLPIQANYTADPYSGPAPLEVAFTDLSTGGANKWNWNFTDGNTSSLQNPVHVFQNMGNYSVRLTVTNASNSTSWIERNITSNQTWSTVNLMTSRACTIHAGGMFKWIVRGTNSSMTVNGTSVSFQDGDRVQISLDKDHSKGRFFMAGEISDCNLTNATLQVNGIKVQQGNVSAIRINDFENFHSNVTLSAGKSYYSWITFLWNGLVVPVSWKRDVVISDLMPTTERYMNLDINATQTYFDGRASGYQFI